MVNGVFGSGLSIGEHVPLLFHTTRLASLLFFSFFFFGFFIHLVFFFPDKNSSLVTRFNASGPNWSAEHPAVAGAKGAGKWGYGGVCTPRSQTDPERFVPPGAAVLALSSPLSQEPGLELSGHSAEQGHKRTMGVPSCGSRVQPTSRRASSHHHHGSE